MSKIVILGGGESGVGSAILAKAKGYDVFLSDSGSLKERYKDELTVFGISYEEGGHTKELVLSADEIIKSPGIPNYAPLVEEATAINIPVLSEIEFAKRYTEAKTICITGSNGKTTTASLIYHILKSAGLNVALGGNIGKSFARQVVEDKFDYFVLELSSFQLENMYSFKADIAILLNITPDHLDRYGYDIEKYADAKMRIIQNQTEDDVFIFWEEDPIISKEMEKITTKGTPYPFANENVNAVAAYAEAENIVINTPDSIFTMRQDMLALTGMHNLYNSLASGLTAKLLHVSDENLRKSLSDFKGVEHRLEKVAKVRGIEFINDSKATNVNSCWYALQSMKTKTVLILGGTDKGNDYSEIEELVKEKVHTLIFMGVDNSKLHQFFDGKVTNIIDTVSMKDAVEKAYASAHEGETVLLSPCCASFDLFTSYEDRGQQFKDCVRKL